MQQQGRGVMNYSTSKPSHGFTTNTTEFDDALLSRGIITMEQAMLAKGANPEEALRLVAMKQEQQRKKTSSLDAVTDNTDSRKDSSDDDDDDFPSVIHSYRKKRIQELQQQKNISDIPLHSTATSIIIPTICRSEWTRCVNEASLDGTWIFIFLSCSSSSSSSSTSHSYIESCIYMEQVLFPILANKHSLHMIQIPSHQAIPHHWPDINLPTLFIYRYGILQYQFIGWNDFGYNKVLFPWKNHSSDVESHIDLSQEDFEILLYYLEIILYKYGILTLSPEEMKEKQYSIYHHRQQRNNNLSSDDDKYGKNNTTTNGWGTFSGQMLTLQTHTSILSKDTNYDLDDDYDTVD